MNKEQIEKLKNIIKKEEKNYNFDDYIFNYINEEDLNEIEDIDQLENYLKKINKNYNITDEDIIYYSEAIKYLQKYDPSLIESIELAINFGYELKNINSEILASLLKSKNNLIDYSSFVDNVINEMEKKF